MKKNIYKNMLADAKETESEFESLEKAVIAKTFSGHLHKMRIKESDFDFFQDVQEEYLELEKIDLLDLKNLGKFYG